MSDPRPASIPHSHFCFASLVGVAQVLLFSCSGTSWLWSSSSSSPPPSLAGSGAVKLHQMRKCRGSIQTALYSMKHNPDISVMQVRRTRHTQDTLHTHAARHQGKEASMGGLEGIDDALPGFPPVSPPSFVFSSPVPACQCLPHRTNHPLPLLWCETWSARGKDGWIGVFCHVSVSKPSFFFSPPDVHPYPTPPSYLPSPRTRCQTSFVVARICHLH